MPLLKISPLRSRITNNFHNGIKTPTLSRISVHHTPQLIRKYSTTPLGSNNNPKVFANYNEAYQWMCNYYRDPEPERLVPAIKQLVSVSSTTVLIGAHKQTIEEPRYFHVESLFTFPLVGFMSELFKKYPGLTYEWFRGLAKVAQELAQHPFSAHKKTFDDVIYLSLLIAGTKQAHHVIHTAVKTILFREIAQKVTGEEKHQAMALYVQQLAKENVLSAMELRDELEKHKRAPEKHLAAALDSKIPVQDIEKEYKILVERLLKWSSSSSARISISYGRFRATGDVAIIHEMMGLFQMTIDKVYTTNNTKLYKFFTTQFRNMLRNFCKYDVNFLSVLIQEHKNVRQSDMRLLIQDLIDEKDTDNEEDHNYMVKDGKHLKAPQKKPPINEKKKQQEEALDRMMRFAQKDFPFIQKNGRRPQRPPRPQRFRRDDDDDEDDDDDDDDDEDD